MDFFIIYQNLDYQENQPMFDLPTWRLCQASSSLSLSV